MTFDELWVMYCKKEPNLVREAAVVEMKAPDFRKALKHAYRAGKAEADNCSQDNKPSVLDSLFGRAFWSG